MLLMNGMFYGDAYTKKCLWSAFLLAVFAIGSVLVGLALSLWWLFGLAGVFGVADVVLYKSLKISVGEYVITEDEEEEVATAMVTKKTKKPVAKPVQQTEKTESKTKQGAQHKAADEKEEKPEASVKEPEPEKIEKREGTFTEGFSDKELKKLFRTYKVKKNHRPVMIDFCSKYRISQCPAYVWVFRGQFHLLLLEEQPRKIMLPQGQMQTMFYERGVKANQRKEYSFLTGRSLMNLVFNEYKPTYYSTIRNNRQEEVKNLYVLGPGMKFTNTSVKELLLLLDPEFVVEDEITKSEEYNQYFKQVYKLKILLQDGGMHIQEYQGKVRSILKHLAEAPLPPAAVRMTLAEMVQKQLISSEYANYYIQYNRQYRERNGGK